MKKIHITILICFMIIASACGATVRENAVPPESQAEISSVEPSPASAAVPDQEPAESAEPAQPVKPPESPERELTLDEEVALKYINEFLNSDDIEEKKNFVKEHAAEDKQGIFMPYASYITKRDVRFRNPHVLDSVPLSIAGQEVTIVLIEGYEDDDCNCREKKEVIILMKDGKMVWGYLDSNDVHAQLSFQLLRNYFKNYAENIYELTFAGSAPAADEEIARVYFEYFHNSTDHEEKREFLNYVHSSTYNMFFQMSQVVTNKDVWLKNAKAVESLQYRYDDKKGSLILVQGESARNKEHMMQVVDGLIAWKYTKINRLEEDVIYYLLRSKFTTSPL